MHFDKGKGLLSPEFLAAAISGHRKHSKMSNTPPAQATKMTLTHVLSETPAWAAKAAGLECQQRGQGCRRAEPREVPRRKPPTGSRGLCAAQREQQLLQHPWAPAPRAQSKLRPSDTAVGLQVLHSMSWAHQPCTVRCSQIKRHKIKTNQENFSTWGNLVLHLLFPVGFTNTNDASVTFPSLEGSGEARDWLSSSHHAAGSKQEGEY